MEATDEQKTFASVVPFTGSIRALLRNSKVQALWFARSLNIRQNLPSLTSACVVNAETSVHDVNTLAKRARV